MWKQHFTVYPESQWSGWILKLLSSAGCRIQSLMRSVAANVALPDVTFQDHFHYGWLKVFQTLLEETWRGAGNNITMRWTHFSILFFDTVCCIIVIIVTIGLTTNRKVRFGFLHSTHKVKRNLCQTMCVEPGRGCRKCSFWQLINFVSSHAMEIY